jgi:hypothetical protein
MNNIQRMYESNSKVRKWLVKNKFNDLHFFPHTRFSKDVHFNGLSFDGCCSLGDKFILFQVKTNTKPTKEIQIKMKDVSEKSGVILIWFNVVKRKGVEVYPIDL